MVSEASVALEHRVLLRTATTKDAVMAGAVLERALFVSHACADMSELLSEFRRGAGALIVAEEVIAGEAVLQLNRALSSQAPWSDIPLLVLARRGADSRAITHVMNEFANVTVIERPMRVASLVSTVRSAMRARRRQYEIRSLLQGLRDTDQRKTEFLATLAHELRNPLAPLSTALSLLALKKPAPEEAQKYYTLMGRQVEHMVRLVNDLMEVSRITRGKIDLQRGSVLLDAVINDAIELSRPLIERSSHTLTVDLPKEALVVQGDSVRLTQVFSNLLNNAAKYTPAGGRVKVRAYQDQRHAVVEVIDDGAGIAPDMLNSIFEMFVQVNGASKAAQGGLGIGLTLVKTLVELHDGTVEASSDGVGRGAKFAVRLPLARDASLSARRAPALRDGLAPSVTSAVLVVDDNQDAADSLRELLASMGSRAFVAYSGEEALRLAAANEFDAAVLDIGMPGMDGCDLARQLRALRGGNRMHLIALTGWGQKEDKERIAAAGFNHHLLKPFDLAQLLHLL